MALGTAELGWIPISFLLASSAVTLAAGTIATFRRFGNQLSVAIPMMVLSVFLGNTVLTDVPDPDFLMALRVIFGIFLGLAVIAIVCSVLQERVRWKGRCPEQSRGITVGRREPHI